MTTNQIIPVPRPVSGLAAQVAKRMERDASAKHLNKVSFYIQDHASDEGWTAAQDLMDKAHEAHKAENFDLAQSLIDQAHALAFLA